MNAQQVIQFMTDFVREHWEGAAFSLFCLVFGAWWGKRRARNAWTKKEFHNRINVSLNTIQDGTLRIRTLLETNLEEIFLNSVAVEMVTAAIPKAVEGKPILAVDKADVWYLLNAVLNEISERFALGSIKKDLNVPTTTGIYLVCLTYEVSGAIRTRKVRAMVIQKDQLLNLPDEMPKLERPQHSTRYETLKKMAEVYRQEPEHFLEVEISV